jgi:hypothetical protein
MSLKQYGQNKEQRLDEIFVSASGTVLRLHDDPTDLKREPHEKTWEGHGDQTKRNQATLGRIWHHCVTDQIMIVLACWLEGTAMSYLMFVTENDFRKAIHKKHLRVSADNTASRLTPLPMYINLVRISHTHTVKESSNFF